MNKKVLSLAIIGTLAIGGIFGVSYIKNQKASKPAKTNISVDMKDAKLTQHGKEIDAKIKKLAEETNLTLSDKSDLSYLVYNEKTDEFISYKTTVSLPIEKIEGESFIAIAGNFNTNITNASKINLNDSFIGKAIDIIASKDINLDEANSMLNKYIEKNAPNFTNKKLNKTIEIDNISINIRNSTKGGFELTATVLK